MRRLTVLALGLGVAACSSSSSPVSSVVKDAAADHHVAAHDAGKGGESDAGGSTTLDASSTSSSTASATATTVHDAGHSKADAHVAAKDASGSPFDAFVYPEAAIPHEAASDAPVSPCSGLPDEASYCAPDDDAGASVGFFVCMQGNGIYTPCAPNTACVSGGSGGGISCQM